MPIKNSIQHIGFLGQALVKALFMDRIRIYMVDDHNLFIKGLQALLSDEKSFHFIGSSTTGDHFLEQYERIAADIILMDINMPEVSGIMLTKMVMDKDPDARILALSMHNSYRHIEKMLTSGALGYSLKSDDLTELVKAIRTVARGKKYISQSIQDTIVDRLGTSDEFEEHDDISKSKLTRRETEILRLILKEHSNTQIAKKLFISHRTVETHRKNIFSKANANSAISLLRYAIKEGLVEV